MPQCIFELMTRDDGKLHNLNSYEIQGLLQLISYKKLFYPEEESASAFLFIKRMKQKPLQDVKYSFIDIFCQHNFANTDYSGLGELNKKTSSDEEVITKMDIEVLLKAFTYIIWTDKTNEGFFEHLVKNYTFLHLFNRLEFLVAEITVPVANEIEKIAS